MPFPDDWWRNVNFLAPLSLHSHLQSKKEMVYVEAEGSTSKGRSGIAREPQQLGGLQVIETTRTSRGARIKMGNPDPGPDPQNERRITAGEIIEELPEFGIEDAVVKERIVTHALPRPLVSDEVFAQFNDFYELQTASARRTRLLRRTTGLYIWDVYRNLLKPELIKAGIPFNNKRLQSVLVTNWLTPCAKEQGYYDFAPEHQRLMMALTADMQRRRRWWLDTAAPHMRNIRVNGIRGTLRVFRLVKNQELTALKLPDL